MTESNLPAKVDEGPTILQALNKGNRTAMVEAGLRTFGGDIDRVAKELATLAIELRRNNVKVIGDHEAFVRHTPDGSLYQVIRPVVLSRALGDLYHIKAWAKNDAGEWYDPTKGYDDLTVQGIEKINAVAGIMTGQPPTVVVDGEHRTNPFIMRSTDGGIMRIVIAVQVIGPVPMTGGPLLSQYTLDYEPRKDFLHMLAEAEKGGEKKREAGKAGAEYCKLVTVDEAQVGSGRKFVELYDGVGYYLDLRAAQVRDVYQDWINLLGNAPKKALTVARRNALLKHPAIGQFRTVKVTEIKDEEGNVDDEVARIAVVGWAGDVAAIGKYQRIAQDIAKGIPVADQGFEVIEAEEKYDPEKVPAEVLDQDEDTIARPSDGAPDETRVEPEGDGPGNDEIRERNALISYIDEGIRYLSPEDVTSLGYDAPNNSTEHLKGIARRCDELAENP